MGLKSNVGIFGRTNYVFNPNNFKKWHESILKHEFASFFNIRHVPLSVYKICI